MGEDRLRDLLAQLARARHQDTADVVAGRPHPLEIRAEGGAPAVEGEDVEEHEQAHDGLAVLPERRDVRLELVIDADVEGRPEEESRPDEHAEQDGEELVDPAPAALELVEAVEIEHGRPEDDDDGDEDEVTRQRGTPLVTGSASITKSELKRRK